MRSSHLLTHAVTLVLLTATAACGPRTGRAAAGNGDSASPATNAGTPTLSRVTPDTIRLGKGEAPTLVLTGSGFVPGSTGSFAAGGNTVRIGPATFDMLPSDASGTTIRFAMPLTFPDTAARGRPASFAPGTFPVAVVTPRGTSNALSLTMIP